MTNKIEFISRSPRCIFTTAPPSALCKDTQFKCGSGECIEDVFYCDEVRDCADGSDETQPECVAQLQARAEMESCEIP